MNLSMIELIALLLQARPNATAGQIREGVNLATGEQVAYGKVFQAIKRLICSEYAIKTKQEGKIATYALTDAGVSRLAYLQRVRDAASQLEAQ